jgi:hypothetical protein
MPAAAALVTGLLSVVGTGALELKPATLAAFETYVRVTELRMAAEVDGRSPFLWVDRQPAAARPGLLARLAAGEVISERLETREGRRAIEAPSGLIHHWIGTVLLPRATLDRVTAFVQNYDQYATVFAPMIQRASILGRTGDVFDVRMRTWAKKVITVVIDADYRVEYRRLSPARLYTRSVVSNVFEVDDAGGPGETRKPADQGTGFLWRLHTYCWFEERPEGVYEQCESVSLTRNAPLGLGWLIRPFITGIPRETLEFTLGKVRNGVRS